MYLNKKEPKKSSGFLRHVCQKLPVLTAAMTAVLLAGCGNQASQTGEETTPTDGTLLYVKDAPGDLPEDLQAIRASGVLRVGIQSGDPPYYQEDPVSGELSGIDVDLAYEAVSRIFGCTPEEAMENNAVDIQTVDGQTAGPLLYDEKLDLLIGEANLTDAFTVELNAASNGEVLDSGEDSDSGNDGEKELHGMTAGQGEKGEETERPDETVPEAFQEIWPENFSSVDSETAGSGESAGNENPASENDGSSEEMGAEEVQPEAPPTPEPPQYWNFSPEYAEGRVFTVLHEKEGLSSQMNRLMEELVNSGKLIQITEKYTKSDR